MKNSRILKIIIIIITIQRHQAQALTAIIRMEGKYSEHQQGKDIILTLTVEEKILIKLL